MALIIAIFRTYRSQGFTIRAPVMVISRTFLVTTARLRTIAAAPMSPSIDGIDTPRAAASPVINPQINDISALMGRMRPVNRSIRSISSHCWILFLRETLSGLAIPFCNSPMVRTLRKIASSSRSRRRSIKRLLRNRLPVFIAGIEGVPFAVRR